MTERSRKDQEYDGYGEGYGELDYPHLPQQKSRLQREFEAGDPEGLVRKVADWVIAEMEKDDTVVREAARLLRESGLDRAILILNERARESAQAVSPWPEGDGDGVLPEPGSRAEDQED